MQISVYVDNQSTKYGEIKFNILNGRYTAYIVTHRTNNWISYTNNIIEPRQCLIPFQFTDIVPNISRSSCWSLNVPSRLSYEGFSSLPSIWSTSHRAVFLYNPLPPLFTGFGQRVMSVDQLLLITLYKMASSNHPQSFFFSLTEFIFPLGLDCHLTYYTGIGLLICCLLLLEWNSCSLLNCKSLEHCSAHHRLWVIFVE